MRCAGHVLTEGNTLLGDRELEMLVILRMNRDFMEFMRKHYSRLNLEQFGRTIIDVDPAPGDESEEEDE